MIASQAQRVVRCLNTGILIPLSLVRWRVSSCEYQHFSLDMELFGQEQPPTASHRFMPSYVRPPGACQASASKRPRRWRTRDLAAEEYRTGSKGVRQPPFLGIPTSESLLRVVFRLCMPEVTQSRP